MYGVDARHCQFEMKAGQWPRIPSFVRQLAEGNQPGGLKHMAILDHAGVF